MLLKNNLIKIMKKSTTSKNTGPVIFESKYIRRIFHEDKWYFSIIDIIGVLSESSDPRNYWKVLKNRLKKEGSELVTKCNQLKMISSDGKYYNTDAGDMEIIFRLIQSIPSKKAEPFKMWLAKVGQERIEEIQNPELALNRSREYWQKYGRSEKWIQQRMMGQETRNKLTDYWKGAGIKNKKENKGGVDEFAYLTNIIHSEWADINIAEHKKLKGLKSQNLRDHMSEAELIFTALAELSTRQIAENINAKGVKENILPAKKGGQIAKNARVALEEKTGKKVVTGENYLIKSKGKKELK